MEFYSNCIDILNMTKHILITSIKSMNVAIFRTLNDTKSEKNRYHNLVI